MGRLGRLTTPVNTPINSKHVIWRQRQMAYFELLGVLTGVVNLAKKIFMRNGFSRSLPAG